MVNSQFGLSTDLYSYSTRKLSWYYLLTVLFYAISGLAMLVSSILLKNLVMRSTLTDSLVVARVLSLKPINPHAGILAGAMVLVSASVSILGAVFQSRLLLKTSAVINVTGLLVTLSFGLLVWFVTLIERREFAVFWQRLSAANTVLIQDRFNCCGYLDSNNPLFTLSSACPTAAIAASKQGCILPITTFADNLLNTIFTSLFGLTSVALISLLTGLVLIKRISELERFRRIDEKRYDTEEKEFYLRQSTSS